MNPGDFDMAEVEALEQVGELEPRDPLDDLFPQQRAFVLSGAKRRAAVCSRRAGKTTADSRLLLKAAKDHPGSISCFFGVTQKVARRLMWPELLRVNREYDLGLRFDASNQEIHCPNGSQLWLCGAKDEAEIEKARGQKYPLVILDEVGSYRASILKALVDEVITPALMDLDGALVLTGTPTAMLSGLFYDVTRPELDLRSPGWEVHRWTVADNPHMPHAREWIEAEKERRGWTEQTPGFLREFRGLWVRSDDLLVYAYDPEDNDFSPDSLQTNEDWHYVLGLDVGWHDRTAFVLACYSRTSPVWYVLESRAEQHLIPSAVAEIVGEYRARHRIERVVMDTGGLGKAIAEEFKRRFHLPIEPADKREKSAFIELMNGDMRRGLIKAEQGSPLAQEWAVLQYDAKRKEDPGQRNDLADAALYAYRASRPYLSREPAKPVDPNSESWGKQHEQKLAKAAQRRRAEASWWSR